MKTALALLLVLAVGASVAMAVRNHNLSRDLDEARSALAAVNGAPVVVQAPATPDISAPRPAVRSNPPPAIVQTNFVSAVSEETLEKAVQSRMEQMRQERNAERERRRQEWENQTPEEREARRQEFQQRMQERAAERLAEFVERTGLDDDQYTAFAAEISDLDSRVRQTAEAWAEAIRESGAFGTDARLQLLNDITSLALDSYAALDEALPTSWREADGDYNILQAIGPDALAPLMEAAREANAPGAMAVMGVFMGGPGGRGGRGGRGGPPMGPGGDGAPPVGPPPGF